MNTKPCNLFCDKSKLCVSLNKYLVTVGADYIGNRNHVIYLYKKNSSTVPHASIRRLEVDSKPRRRKL